MQFLEGSKQKITTFQSLIVSWHTVKEDKQFAVSLGVETENHNFSVTKCLLAHCQEEGDKDSNNSILAHCQVGQTVCSFLRGRNKKSQLFSH